MAGQSVVKVLSVFGKAFKTFYDFIGIVVLASALFFFIGLSPVVLILVFGIQIPAVIAAAFIALIFTLGPALGGSSHMLYLAVQGEDVLIRDFFRGMFRFYWRSLAMALVAGLFLLVLVIDFVFFFNNPNSFFRVLSGIWVYFFLFWGTVMNFTFPVLIQQDDSVFSAIKKSGLIVLDNMVFSLLLLFGVLIVTVLSVFLTAAMMLVWAGIVGLVQHYALLEILEKYRSYRIRRDEVDGVKDSEEMQQEALSHQILKEDEAGTDNEQDRDNLENREDDA